MTVPGTVVTGWVWVGPKGIAYADRSNDWLQPAVKHVTSLSAKSKEPVANEPNDPQAR